MLYLSGLKGGTLGADSAQFDEGGGVPPMVAYAPAGWWWYGETVTTFWGVYVWGLVWGLWGFMFGVLGFMFEVKLLWGRTRTKWIHSQCTASQDVLLKSTPRIKCQL